MHQVAVLGLRSEERGMGFRSASIIATFLIGLEGLGCQAFAQYYPYPPPRAHLAPSGPSDRPPSAIDADDDPRDTGTLPPEVRPETGSKKEPPPQFRRTLVDYDTKEPAGTIIVDKPNTYLYLVTPHQRREAMQRLANGEAQANVASFNVSQATISRLAAPSPFEASVVAA
jgi:lipoprotein-anchoring transpeptidase ErfK/SrfK